MNSPQPGCCLPLVFAVALFCTGCAQSGQVQEQGDREKITGKEAESSDMQKQNRQIQPAGADKAIANPPSGEAGRRATGTLPLNCQTYPDGRTECR